MKITPSGPHTKGSRSEMVRFIATTPEDEQSLRVLYDLFYKFGSTEVLASLAGSARVGETLKQIDITLE